METLTIRMHSPKPSLNYKEYTGKGSDLVKSQIITYVWIIIWYLVKLLTNRLLGNSILVKKVLNNLHHMVNVPMSQAVTLTGKEKVTS